MSTTKVGNAKKKNMISNNNTTVGWNMTGEWAGNSKPKGDKIARTRVGVYSFTANKAK